MSCRLEKILRATAWLQSKDLQGMADVTDTAEGASDDGSVLPDDMETWTYVLSLDERFRSTLLRPPRLLRKEARVDSGIRDSGSWKNSCKRNTS